jgi:hypothetical protein
VALAARAGQWGTVEVLARQLGEHRRSRSAPDITDIEAERRRRQK